MLYFEKYEFDECEKIGWGNRMIKINKEYFASINHYGNISNSISIFGELSASFDNLMKRNAEKNKSF